MGKYRAPAGILGEVQVWKVVKIDPDLETKSMSHAICPVVVNTHKEFWKIKCSWVTSQPLT